MSHKYVYLFSEGNASMRELLGGKGANLAEMTNIGLPVPQGFTISTEACTQYYEDGRQINPDIQAEIMEYIAKMEEITGKKFGDTENPLLVSVPMTNQTTIGNNAAGTAWQYDVTVYPKNQTINNPKRIIKEDDKNTLIDHGDYEIGETVHQVLLPEAPMLQAQYLLLIICLIPR